MPRPIKQGLNYFPIDIDMDNDDKIELIEAVHGVEGFGIIVKLLMRIYREGYFYPWTEKEKTLFAGKINKDVEQVQAIVDDAIRWGFFDKKAYREHQVLTSSGIQKRYLEATKRRNEIKMYAKILLIDINEYINIVLVNNNPTNVNIYPQSKVKESKGKETSVNVHLKNSFNRFWEIYPRKTAKQKAWEKWIKLKPDDDLVKQICISIETHKKTPDWQKDNGTFVPYPATFLNQKRWEDEIRVKESWGQF